MSDVTIHVKGTTVTIEATFKDKADALADVTTLKYRPYLDSSTPLAQDVVLNPTTTRDSLGVYSFDYVIPVDLDTDTRKQITLVVTATVDSIVKVGTVTIQIDWRL